MDGEYQIACNSGVQEPWAGRDHESTDDRDHESSDGRIMIHETTGRS